MSRVTKKEIAKQEKYYKLMEDNAKEFSTLIIERLGLEPQPSTGLLIVSDELYDGNLVYFTYDGFKYIPFEYQQYYENIQDVKVFDPYNNINLCTNIIMWYICNIMGRNADDVDLIGVTNAKMNDKGAAFIKFEDKPDKMVGHEYNRDCLKYMDLVYKLDDAHELEYKRLQDLDMKQYDEFEL